jgi:hypothetical protein
MDIQALNLVAGARLMASSTANAQNCARGGTDVTPLTKIFTLQQITILSNNSHCNRNGAAARSNNDA